MGGCCYREQKTGNMHSIPKKAEKPEKAKNPTKKQRFAQIDENFRSKSAQNQEKIRRKNRSCSVKIRGSLKPTPTPNLTSFPSKSEEQTYCKSEIPLKRLKFPIHQKYTFKDEIIRSSSGQVSLVEHSRTKLLHIIRKIPKSDDSDSRQELILRKEIDLLSEIDHPNVMKIAQILVDRTHFYVVSEAVIGCKLTNFKNIAELQSEDAVADVMLQLLQAMSYCHGRGISHKNLSIGTVLLFETTVKKFLVKVIGFGSTRSRSEENLSLVTSQLLYAAPEVFSGEWTDKGDVWSCGIVLHLLLTKTVPFYGTSKADLRESLEQPFKPAVSLPSDLQSLLQSMLHPKPSARLSAVQCLSHPFFLHHQAYVTSTNLNSALTNLKTFVCGQRIKMIILSFISAHVISPDEKQPLIDVFRRIDTDSDGKLGREELAKAYESTTTPEIAQLIAAHVMESVDFDHNGLIDFSEFMVAASNHRSLLTHKNLKIAYELFDQDNSGEITIDELKTTLKCEESEEQWEDLLQQVDTDTDLKLNFKEFSVLIRMAVEQAETLRRQNNY